MGRRLTSALSRVPTGFARYLDTRKLLRGSVSKQSRQGLDWMNFFLADIQTGFGAFVAFYLAELGWPKSQTSTRVGPAAVKYHNLKGGYGLNLFTGDNERQPNLIVLGTRRGEG